MKYSVLTKMTANVLAIFITNVDIKRTFNLTRQIVDVNRVRLFLKTIKQIMMLKCFSNFISFKKKKSSFEFKRCLLKKRKLIVQIKIDEQNKIMGITLSMFTMKNVKNKKNANHIIENDFN